MKYHPDRPYVDIDDAMRIPHETDEDAEVSETDHITQVRHQLRYAMNESK